jgi:hypothetical protein
MQIYKEIIWDGPTNPFFVFLVGEIQDLKEGT